MTQVGSKAFKDNSAIEVPTVVHFLSDHRIGGPQVYVQSLVSLLAEDVDSLVVTCGECEISDYYLVNLRHYWKPLYVLEVLINVVQILIKSELRSKNVVFHVHGSVNLAPLIAAALGRISIVWHIHETSSRLRIFNSMGRVLLKRTRHKVACVAKSCAESFDLDDYVIVPCFVDEKFWSATAVSDAMAQVTDVGDQVLRLTCVANMNPLKGLDILLRALEKIQCRWSLKIVGASLSTQRGYAKEIEVIAHGIRRKYPFVNIEFVGWQSRYSIRSILNSTDIFVLPSRSEACPIALLEALSLGCCCVATDVGDVSDIMANAIPPGAVVNCDSESISQAIAERKKCSGKGPSGTSYLYSPWHSDVIRTKVLELYYSLARTD